MNGKKVTEEQERGMEAANQLSFVLPQSQNNEPYQHREAFRVSRDTHSASIIQSFDDALSINLSNPNPSSPSYYNVIPGQSLRPVTVTTELKEDGYTWRKYGQKSIVNSEHPREYFRCGLKDQGCQATKKVQVISNSPTRYKIVYYGQHSCQNYQLLRDVIGQDSKYMLSFGCSTTSESKTEPKFKPKQVVCGKLPMSSSSMIQEENKPSNTQDNYAEFSADDLMITNQWPETPFPMDIDMVSSMWDTRITSPHLIQEDYSYLLADYDDIEPDTWFSEIKLWD